MNIDKNNHKKGFNYRITEFFLNNTRLTILSFVLIVVMGILSVIVLNTTGFPNPEIKFVIVNTSYPGASSQTVEKEVSIPIESVVKEIDGVVSYNSNSSDSFSSIGVEVSEDVLVSDIKTEIDSGISSIRFPDGVNSPQLFEPEIGGPDFLYLVRGTSPQSTFDTVTKITDELNSVSQTSKIVELNPIERFIEIGIDDDKINELGLQFDSVRQSVESFGSSIPVTSGEVIDGKNSSVIVNLNESKLDDLKNFEFTSQNGTKSKLTDFATVEIVYDFESDSSVFSGVTINDKKQVVQGSVLDIRLREGSDSGEYKDTVKEIIEDLDGVDFVEDGLLDNFKDKNYVYPLYSVTDANDEQVSEVVGGLIGGPLEIENQSLAQIGWLLGGIQLVFLVMIAFVSWRAAIIAAVSIPLSLVFSTIYLLLTGNDLNTLVLFSLVLVIGLVVDPALVILESIQRKVDIGLRGKAAALAAIKDVGGGLFLATLTNIIVFAPFGLISGVLGQIFGYIPLTIIPAVVGSYVVPLIFLAWIGGGFLRKERGVKEDASEEENLWGIAKGLKQLNLAILQGSGFVRFLIIIAFIVLSFGVTSYYFGTRQVQSVQFSGTSDSDFIIIGGQFKAETVQANRNKLTNEVVAEVLNNENVENVYKFDTGFSYIATLVDSSDRDLLASEIVEDVKDDLAEKKPQFFDLTVDVESNGPPASSYQVAISISEKDQRKLRTSSIAVGQVIDRACLRDGVVDLVEDCGDQGGDVKLIDQVDNGIEGREANLVEINLDRLELEVNQLTSPGLPVGFNVASSARGLFDFGNLGDNPSITIDDKDFDLRYIKTNVDEVGFSDIESLEITNFTGGSVGVSEIGEVENTTPKSSIQRVNGEVVNIVQARLVEDWNDEATAASVISKVTEFYSDDDYDQTKMLGLRNDAIGPYSEGSSEGFARSFQELIFTLVLAIFLTYFVLAIFFGSLTLPLVVLYTIPLTFIGIFPAISHLGLGEFGFLEIIGLIILIGIVENAAIFLVDSARQYIREGMDELEAISLASAIRMRPILLTTLTATASLAPLAFFSEFYRSLSLVIIFGLLTSGLISLITTPILFTFFTWLSREYRNMRMIHRILFFPLFPFYIIYMIINSNYRIVKVNNKVRDVNLYNK